MVIAYFLPARSRRRAAAAPRQFMLLGVLLGIVLGGSQALSRSLFSQLIPKGKEGEYFGLYEISDKGTSWLGPLLFGARLPGDRQLPGRHHLAGLVLRDRVLRAAGDPDAPGHHRRRQRTAPRPLAPPLVMVRHDQRARSARLDSRSMTRSVTFGPPRPTSAGLAWAIPDGVGRPVRLRVRDRLRPLAQLAAGGPGPRRGRAEVLLRARWTAASPRWPCRWTTTTPARAAGAWC